MIKATKHHSTPKIDKNTSKTQKLSINDLILAFNQKSQISIRKKI